MQFAEVQGGGFAAPGLLLLAMQLYILFSSTRQLARPIQAPASPTQVEQITKFLPGIVGWLALSVGGYLVFLQRKQGSNEESLPEETRSGFPM
jgi:hypothetical protein